MSGSFSNSLIVTIDGSAGCGKSTVARKTAKRLGALHLNSGALFRATAYHAAQQGVALEDIAGLCSLISRLNFEFSIDSANTSNMLVNGRSIDKELLDDEWGERASILAVHPPLRMLLRAQQHAVAGIFGRIVVEGRDAGSVVFPQAVAAFFITADLHVRTVRRFSQLKKYSDSPPSFDEIKQRIERRDRRDETRLADPQKPAPWAEILDTSKMRTNKIVNYIEAQVLARATVKLSECPLFLRPG